MEPGLFQLDREGSEARTSEATSSLRFGGRNAKPKETMWNLKKNASGPGGVTMPESPSQKELKFKLKAFGTLFSEGAHLAVSWSFFERFVFPGKQSSYNVESF